MKLHVAFDENGRIVGAAEAAAKGGGDRPVVKPGLTVAELEVPKEFVGAKLSEYAHRLQVDIGTGKLVSKR